MHVVSALARERQRSSARRRWAGVRWARRRGSGLGSSWAVWVRRAAALGVLFGLGGCGRKATQADCEAFWDKNVEVKLKAEGVTDPAFIEKRQLELRHEFRDAIEKCVGRLVTDRMLECVARAETADQIDSCLR